MIGRLYPEGEMVDPLDGATMSTSNITFQVTDDCNLKCTYCYQINKGKHKMPLDVAKKFIDLLLDNDENTREYINTRTKQAVILDFIGGEPLLEVELIDQIVDYFVQQAIIKDHPWQYHYVVSISSNGTLYFEPKVQEFIKKHLSHLSLSISVDGNKQLHDACRVFEDGTGSYDIAIAAVHHYVDVLGGNMGSKMTLAPENIAFTYEAVVSLIEEGYTEINLNCVYEEGWTAEHAAILYEQLKLLADYILENDLQDKIYVSIFENHFFCPKSPEDIQNWCGGTGSMISVDWKGDIYPCIRYMESSLGTEIKPLIIGNVHTGTLVTPDQCSIDQCLKCVNRRTQSTDECFNCPIAEGCSWCSAYNYQCFGTVDKRATYICIMHKARCLANAYYWNKYYILNGSNERFKLWIPDEWALEIIDENELNLLKFFEEFPYIPLD
jgi:radical SAM peptide maturase (CXXX-repeat target family)